MSSAAPESSPTTPPTRPPRPSRRGRGWWPRGRRPAGGAEATAALPAGSRMLAKATTPGGEAVILAAREGRGMVIRTGLPDFPSRLSHGGNEQDLVKRIWELLAQ